MRKLIALALPLLVSVTIIAQDSLPRPGTKDFYLRRSNNQRSAGRTLLIAGPLLIGAGFLIGDRKESTFNDAATGAFIGGIGVLSCIGSIPLFIASGRNRDKARYAPLSITLNRSVLIKGPIATTKAYPAVALQIPITNR